MAPPVSAPSSGSPVLLSPPSRAWHALPIVRLMVGTVFVSEGVQKFLFPDDVGAGRFERMGFPDPEVIGPLVGVAEITFGALVLVGLLTRPAAVGLLVIMAVAILTTKVPILLGHDLGPFAVRSLDRYGFWAMAHEMRTDWAMLLGSTVLVVAGSGPWAVDAALRRRSRAVDPNAGDDVPRGAVPGVPSSSGPHLS